MRSNVSAAMPNVARSVKQVTDSGTIASPTRRQVLTIMGLLMPNKKSSVHAMVVIAGIAIGALATTSQASSAGNVKELRASQTASSSTAPKPAPSFRRGQNQSSDGNIEDMFPSGVSTSRPTFSANTSSKRTLEATIKKNDLDGSSPGGTIKANANIFENGVAQKPSSTSVPPDVYRAWLEKTHPQFALNVSASPKESLIEVKGQWDDSARTLKNLGIPFTRIRAGQLHPEVLSAARVLIINCAGELKRDQLQEVRDFVSNGGYLLTTDWSLDNMLQQTFPGYVEWNRGKSDRNMYSSTIVNPDPVLFDNTVRSAYWKLDLSAHMIRIRRPDAVRVLCTSPELASEDPDHMGALAVVFRFGKGYVLHMVGHFDNNSGIALGNLLPDPAPGIGISLRQAMATNFVVAGLTRTPIPMNVSRH